MPVEIPESHRDLLDKKSFAHIATLGPHGEPQSTPVWCGLVGGRVVFSNTKGRQKYRNLVRDPRIALSIVDPDNPYRSLEVRGDASIVDDPDKAFINEMANKYIGQDYPWSTPDEQRVIIQVTPEHVTTTG